MHKKGKRKNTNREGKQKTNDMNKPHAHIYSAEINKWLHHGNIHSATAEIRRQKKKKKKIEEETTGQKYNGLPYSIGRPKYNCCF